MGAHFHTPPHGQLYRSIKYAFRTFQTTTSSPKIYALNYQCPVQHRDIKTLIMRVVLYVDLCKSSAALFARGKRAHEMDNETIEIYVEWNIKNTIKQVALSIRRTKSQSPPTFRNFNPFVYVQCVG